MVQDEFPAAQLATHSATPQRGGGGLVFDTTPLATTRWPLHFGGPTPLGMPSAVQEAPALAAASCFLPSFSLPASFAPPLAQVVLGLAPAGPRPLGAPGEVLRRGPPGWGVACLCLRTVMLPCHHCLCVGAGGGYFCTAHPFWVLFPRTTTVLPAGSQSPGHSSHYCHRASSRPNSCAARALPQVLPLHCRGGA